MGVLDAAVCVDADEFFYVTPSSMGWWIGWMRKRIGRESFRVVGGEGVDEELRQIWQGAR